MFFLKGLYPEQSPMWFSESEDSLVTDIIAAVGKISTSSNNLLLGMLRYLVKELLTMSNSVVPNYVENLDAEETEVGLLL